MFIGNKQIYNDVSEHVNASSDAIALKKSP